MTAAELAPFIAGLVAGAAAIPLLARLSRAFHVEVEDQETVLVTRFGRLAETLDRPGWHWVWDRWLPWVDAIHVSRRSDFRTIEGICVNDTRGTTVVVDIWLELQIVDPARARFSVADWDASLRNVVSHAVIALLGNREFQRILCDRTELAALVQQEVAHETERWGLKIENLFIRDVSLLPDVQQQVHASIAARLERAKADIEENGRQRVALLEAETAARLAEVVAEARAQYPTAVGRAYAALSPAVLRAYEELHGLSLLRPHRTLAFTGFDDGGVRAIDAAMLGTLGENPPANGQGEARPAGSAPRQ